LPDNDIMKLQKHFLRSESRYFFGPTQGNTDSCLECVCIDALLQYLFAVPCWSPIIAGWRRELVVRAVQKSTVRTLLSV